MSNKVVEVIVGRTAPLGMRILCGFGYRFDGNIDDYIRKSMQIVGTSRNIGHREFLASWFSFVLFAVGLAMILIFCKCVLEAVYVFLVAILIPLWILRWYRRQAEVIRREIAKEMPQFLGVVAILLSAGLSLTSAIRAVVMTDVDDTILKRMLRETVTKVDRGVPIVSAWTDFGNRCAIAEASSLATLVVRENTIGSKGAINSLRTMCESADNSRQRNVLRAGEEARTKLLAPQTLIFANILVLVGYPAFVALGGI